MALFVPAWVVLAQPTGMTQTGVAPAGEEISPIGWAGIGAFALLALGEIGRGAMRHRVQKPGPTR